MDNLETRWIFGQGPQRNVRGLFHMASRIPRPYVVAATFFGGELLSCKFAQHARLPQAVPDKVSANLASKVPGCLIDLMLRAANPDQ